jgi:uncharacterized protein DUF1905
MKFHSTVENNSGGQVRIEVPEDDVEALAAGKRPAVTVTIGSHTFRAKLSPLAGRYYVPLSAEDLEAAGLEEGVEVDAEIDLDPEA